MKEFVSATVCVKSASVCGLRSKHDERTGLNWPLVYRLWHQLKRRVAMSGRDKRWKHLSAKPTPRLGVVRKDKISSKTTTYNQCLALDCETRRKRLITRKTAKNIRTDSHFDKISQKFAFQRRALGIGSRCKARKGLSRGVLIIYMPTIPMLTSIRI